MNQRIVGPALTAVTSVALLAACGILSPVATQPQVRTISATAAATYWPTAANGQVIATAKRRRAQPTVAPTATAAASAIIQTQVPAATLPPLLMELTATTQPTPTETPIPPTIPPTDTPTDTPSTTANTVAIEAIRNELLSLHNAARALDGLPPYAINPQLQRAAQTQADWLALKPVTELWSLGTRAHIGANNSTFQQRIAAAGYPGASRNVNENSGTFATANEAFDWWMNDPDGAPTHRPSILSRQYREIGIGVAPHSTGLGIVFIITFGAP